MVYSYYSNYFKLFGVKFLISYPICIMNSPPDCPLSFLQHHEDGYKDSRLRICFRVQSDGAFKCSRQPSCSMIYLKHPSFGIQLKHLTTEKKRYRHFEHEKSEMHAGYAKRPHSSPFTVQTLVVFNGSQFFLFFWGNQEL